MDAIWALLTALSGLSVVLHLGTENLEDPRQHLWWSWEIRWTLKKWIWVLPSQCRQNTHIDVERCPGSCKISAVMLQAHLLWMGDGAISIETHVCTTFVQSNLKSSMWTMSSIRSKANLVEINPTWNLVQQLFCFLLCHNLWLTMARFISEDVHGLSPSNSQKVGDKIQSPPKTKSFWGSIHQVHRQKTAPNVVPKVRYFHYQLCPLTSDWKITINHPSIPWFSLLTKKQNKSQLSSIYPQGFP